MILILLEATAIASVYYLIAICVALVALGTALGAFVYGLKLGKSRAEDHRIKPFKEAAEGWEKRSDQLETELGFTIKESEGLRSQYEDMRLKHDQLMIDYVKLSQTNQRQQGEIDRLSAEVQTLSEFKNTLENLITRLQKA